MSESLLQQLEEWERLAKEAIREWTSGTPEGLSKAEDAYENYSRSPEFALSLIQSIRAALPSEPVALEPAGGMLERPKVGYASELDAYCDRSEALIRFHEKRERGLLDQLEESRRVAHEWVTVEERSPEDIFNVIVWIPNQTPRGGYWDLASYGEWFCEDEDCKPGDAGYVEDNDDGNRRGFGWHRTEDTHGGPYDYVTIDLTGKITHWRPLPASPESLRAQLKEGE